MAVVLIAQALLTFANGLTQTLLDAMGDDDEVVEHVPQEVIAPDTEESIQSTRRFIVFNTQFASYIEQRAHLVIGDIPPGLRHHSLESILSRTAAVSSIIGMSIEDFGRLYAFVENDLSSLYPNSPRMASEEHRFSRYCGNRMKLFLCLYRLKVGCSFSHIEAVFGWASTTVSEWFIGIIPMLERCLHNFHEGILDTLGLGWQAEQLRLWREKHEADNTLVCFLERIAHHNSRGGRHILIEPTDQAQFLGSIGAVDGTYTVRCRVSASVYAENGLNPTDDCMYSDYIKQHAWKLSVITSHDLGYTPQLILHVSVHSGNTSDSSAYSFAQLRFMKDRLLKGSFLLGDSAYFFDRMVVPLYSKHQIDCATITVKNGMTRFNGSLSSDRVCAENGIGALKQWGVMRGRGDICLFSKTNLFRSCVRVCWGLTNFLRLGS